MQFASPKVQNWPHQPPKITSQASRPPSGMSEGGEMVGRWGEGGLAFSRSVVLLVLVAVSVSALGGCGLEVVLFGLEVTGERFMVWSLVMMVNDCEE